MERELNIAADVSEIMVDTEEKARELLLKALEGGL
jgi:hypothetical protein